MGWRPGPRGFCSSSWTGVWTRSAPPSRYNKIYLILARLSSVVDARATISWRPAGRAPPFSPARQRRGRRTIMAEQTAFTPDDFWLMRFVTDMRLSPDGSLLAYAVQSNDRAANETRSAIWLWSAATGQARQLTSGARRDTNPRWSPDGHLLAFESDRAGGKTQVWVVPVDGGEARQVSHLRRGASDPVWTADGASLHRARPGAPGGESAGAAQRRAGGAHPARERRSRPAAHRHPAAVPLGWQGLLRRAHAPVSCPVERWRRRAAHEWRLRPRRRGILPRRPRARLCQRPRRGPRRQHDQRRMAAGPGDARAAPAHRRGSARASPGVVAGRYAAGLPGRREDWGARRPQRATPRGRRGWRWRRQPVGGA